MRLTYLAYSFSLAVMYFSIVLLIPIVVAFYYHESHAVLPFIVAGAIALMISATLRKIVPGTAKIKSINDIKKSEGLCVVTLSWIFAGLLASVHYMFLLICNFFVLFLGSSVF